jgi:hypothetical protein
VLTTFSLEPNGKHRVNICIMRRRLVLTNEAAGHPMRRRLPPPPRPRPRADQDHDWKLFVLSFSAFFVCFYTFFV